MTRSTSISSAPASASRVGTDQGSLPRKTTRKVVIPRPDAARRRTGDPSSPNSMRRSSAITDRGGPRRRDDRCTACRRGGRSRAGRCARAAPLPSPRSGRRRGRCPRQVIREKRGVSWYGPGIDRHPSSSSSSPCGSMSTGLAMNTGPVSPSSKTNSRSEMPTCGPARPTPGASYIVSSMSSRSARRRRSNSVTGFAGSRSTGSPRVRMRMITSSRSVVPSSLIGRSTGGVRPRRGSTRRCLAAGELASRPPERRHALAGRARASIPSAPRPTRRACVIGSSAASAASSSVRPATRKTAEPTGNPASRPASPFIAMEPGRVAPAPAPGRPDRSACEDCTMARPSGRAHATASVQVVTRSLASREARTPIGEIGVEDRDEVEPARDRSRARRQARRRGSRPSREVAAASSRPSRRTGTGRLAQPTPRPAPRPPATEPEVARAATPAATRAPRRPRSEPIPRSSAARRRTPRTPPAARTIGRPRRCRSPGSGENTNARDARRSARTSRGARPSGPGFTTSTGAQLAPLGRHGRQAERRGLRRRGAARDSTTTAPLDAQPRARATSRAW